MCTELRDEATSTGPCTNIVSTFLESGAFSFLYIRIARRFWTLAQPWGSVAVYLTVFALGGGIGGSDSGVFSWGRVYTPAGWGDGQGRAMSFATHLVSGIGPGLLIARPGMAQGQRRRGVYYRDLMDMTSLTVAFKMCDAVKML